MNQATTIPTAAEPVKKAPSKPRCQRHSQPLAPSHSSSQARLQTAAILEVLAGLRRPAEAAQALGTSLPRYYQLERRALLGMLSACEPAPRGPRADPSKQVKTLERENRLLQRECARQQALVRSVERSLGLAQVITAKSSEKPGKNGKEEKPVSGKRKRKRRPAVRALRAIAGLKIPESSPASPSSAQPIVSS